MKISDSLGNLYTHTMFKKKSYEMKDDADEITVAVPSKNKKYADDDDNDSVSSDQSEDSIGSSHHHHQPTMSRRQSERKASSSRARSVRFITMECF